MSNWLNDRIDTKGLKPLPTEVEVGQIVINTVDKMLWSKDPAGNVIPVGGAIADATGKAGQELSTRGTDRMEHEWSPFRTTPQVITEDYTLQDGVNASIVSGTLDVGVTVTIPVGSIMVVL